MSPEAMDLIKKLLEPLVEERWTAQQAVRHEWFLPRASTHRATPDSQRSEGFSQTPADYARATLRGLRRWRQHPFLRKGRGSESHVWWLFGGTQCIHSAHLDI